MITAKTPPAASAAMPRRDRLSPSEADIEATRQLKAAGEILGIAVLDHLIFNRKEHFSFLENGTAF